MQLIDHLVPEISRQGIFGLDDPMTGFKGFDPKDSHFPGVRVTPGFDA